MKQTLCVLLILACATGRAGADEPVKDSLKLAGMHEHSLFSSNLDSLLYLWVVQNTPGIFDPDTIPTGDPIVDFPDSVYVERLKRIPSVVELSYNSIVRNYIRVYTGQKRKNMEVMLGLADHYFPVFEQIFDQYGLPVELKYMAVIESALNPRAVSRVGATGIWQFMYGTGRMYGLTINSLVDERRDPVRATHAAAQYLRDLYNIYNDWVLVIAAYNCGPGNVNKAIRRSGNKRNYWDLFYYLPRETRGYVPAFIAATYVMNHYRDHGLVPREIDMPVRTDTIMVHENLHLAQVSEVMDIPLQLLRDLNPQYRRDVVPAMGTGFSLTLPFNQTTRFIDLQDSVLAYRHDHYFNEENRIINPTYSRYVPEPPTGKVKLTYTVKSGDNLGYIAEWYNVRVSDLRYWNNIRGNLIRAGQSLAVYVSPGDVEKYKPVNSLSFAEKQRRIGKTVASPASAPVASGAATDTDYVYYRVRSGDTLWDIARKYPGVTDSEIMQLNKLKYGDKIVPGQMLKIMKKG
ncbi:MAG TPA: LysM peptidoglycan-binding domain-containing protein [Bacteroidetes bacterium]|nr:LysM peptidoglycan-binding domain-containing protein [Bacteroidota bacterium]